MKESGPTKMRTYTNRRRFLQVGTAALGTTAVGSTAVEVAQASTEEWYKIREGTADETEVVVIDSGVGGSTAVVVGGIHGDEAAGYRAAQKMREWSIDEGKLVLIPESNPTAIESGTLSNDNGNLNRKFPPGETPTTPLARAIWDVVTSHDADLVFNLHSSKGIYQEDVGPSGVGQAIYPTTASGARQNATRTVEYMNTNHLGDSQPDYHRFKRGNLITGDRPLLIHKTDHDLQKPGFIVEVTRYDTSVDTRINWTLQIVEHLLSQYSITRTSTGTAENTSDDRSTDASNGASDEQSSSETAPEQESNERRQLEQLLNEYEDTTWARLIRSLI
ncbi:succinylglutamate desuccinylase/aspartoacylase family protein [Natrinema soli]|uniref:Succinylglutamate desuccinylase/aspartoacylase family protein n=1 Tax=Natrinema soli TaxID=1930624 RepID=A0ABD5SNM2_9EURY|nr:succinylglutamate desuccinylase/aspartoacylase family protein [Natrinema soli]